MLSPILYPASSAALTVSITPDDIQTSVLTTSGSTVSSFVATPTGGYGTKTYSWAILSQAGTGTISITNPTNATTTITYTGLYFAGSEVTGTVRCTVTDQVGTTAYANAAVTIMQDGYGSGDIP